MSALVLCLAISSIVYAFGPDEETVAVAGADVARFAGTGVEEEEVGATCTAIPANRLSALVTTALLITCSKYASEFPLPYPKHISAKSSLPGDLHLANRRRLRP